ncbi:MAG: hypothetical protein WD696_16515, partial [Bryobacteraceae bacterium]
SLGRRIELTRQVRELCRKAEFLQAGVTPGEKAEAALLSFEIERLYVLWGLREVQGLEIDGAPATPEAVVSTGPEEFFAEVLQTVKAQCGLTETERKN